MDGRRVDKHMLKSILNASEINQTNDEKFPKFLTVFNTENKQIEKEANTVVDEFIQRFKKKVNGMAKKMTNYKAKQFRMVQQKLLQHAANGSIAFEYLPTDKEILNTIFKQQFPYGPSEPAKLHT